VSVIKKKEKTFPECFVHYERNPETIATGMPVFDAFREFFA
jgi:hypothetical protein